MKNRLGKIFSVLKGFKRWPELLLLFIFLSSIGIAWRTFWVKDSWVDAVRSDGVAYYSYLPATYIYHDHTYSFIDTLMSTYPNLRTTGHYFCAEFEGNRVNRFFIGESVLVTPFFLLTHQLTRFTDYPRDGYSEPYMIGLHIAALFYVCLGLWLLIRFFRKKGLNDFTIFTTIALIYFGTNLNEYTIYEPSMTHGYSFSMVCLFIYLIDSILRDFTLRKLLGLGLVTGLIVAIRPVNLLVVFSIPFLAGNKETLFNFFKTIFRKPVWLLAALLLFALGIFPQLYTYYTQTGQWYVYSYKQEKFHFDQPHMFAVLFSYANGAFVYSPLLFICLLGLIPLYFKDLFKAVSITLFLLVVVYVISCWWYWTYAGAFGMRPLVEYIPFFALLFTTLFTSLHRVIRAGTILLIILPLCALLQFQLWQYRLGMINYMDMTSAKYWRVFLQTGDQFMWYGSEPPMPSPPAGAKLIATRNFNFDSSDPLVLQPNPFVDDQGHKSFVLKFGVNNNSPIITGKISDLIPDTLQRLDSLWFDYSFLVKSDDRNTDAGLCYYFLRGETSLLWTGYPFVRQLNDRWKWVRLHVFIPAPIFLDRNDTWGCTFTKNDDVQFLIDDMTISVYRKQ